MVKVYIPDDTTSISLFSDEIAKVISLEAKKRGINIQLIRNGSRGLFKFEPLVEIENKNGRFAFGPVTFDNAGLLFENNVFLGNFSGYDNNSTLLNGTAAESFNRIFLGESKNIPQLKKQSRLVFNRVGLIDPLSLDDYKNNGGLSGIKNAIDTDSNSIIEILKKSGLRGRGGAGFPAYLKWETVLNAKSEVKYIVCNADEGDSGTFADRMLLEGDPFAVIEGMAIAGITVYAEKGYIYLRSEYFKAAKKLEKALKLSYKEGLLGKNIFGTDKSFDINLIVGAGSYICGEETALLESIENKRGMVRVRPPVPAISGLYNKPTILNNVTTFASVTHILSRNSGRKNFESFGGHQRIDNPEDDFSLLGTETSKGTIPFQLSGAAACPGLYELPAGISLRKLVLDMGGCSAEGGHLKFVQIGGPLGAYFPATDEFLDIKLSYEAVAEKGGLLGHGGVVVFDEDTDMKLVLTNILDFCVHESCGKCTPCRIGSIRLKELFERVLSKQNVENNLKIISEILETMKELSLCGLGSGMYYPVNSLLKYFKEEILS
jgi:formate dehydrogenase iron-sulfur subunit